MRLQGRNTTATVHELRRGVQALHQVQTSTAEAPGLESNVYRTCLGIDLRLLSLPLSRNRSRFWKNENIDRHPRSSVRREGLVMSLSEAFRCVVDESVESMELAPGKALATGLVTMLREPRIAQARKEDR